MKKLICKCLFFLPLIFVLGLIEYSAANFSPFNKVENAISRAMLNGKNVAFSPDFDDRMVQKLYIKAIQNKNDIAVIGSSRSMKIDAGLFKNKAFFNNSVTGADIEDYIGIYQIYRSRNLAPRAIILGLDPWIVDKRGTSFRWLSLGKEFNQLTGSFPISGNPLVLFWYYGEKFQELYSLRYFQYSVMKILKNIVSSIYIHITDQNEDFFPVIHKDGSVAESLKIRSKSANDVAEEINSLSSKCTANLLNGGLNKEKEYLFLNFLKILKNDKVSVIFWLAPIHPIMYSSMLTDPSCHWTIEAEIYFRKIAQDNNIKVIGSYNPNNYTLDGDDFFDSTHVKREAIEKIFKKDGI